MAKTAFQRKSIFMFFHRSDEQTNKSEKVSQQISFQIFQNFNSRWINRTKQSCECWNVTGPSIQSTAPLVKYRQKCIVITLYVSASSLQSSSLTKYLDTQVRSDQEQLLPSGLSFQTPITLPSYFDNDGSILIFQFFINVWTGFALCGWSQTAL